MAYYTRYEKLQKYYKDGTAVEPAVYKKGTNLGVAEYSSIEVCEGQPEPEPGNYTCCITWESYDENINFSFNNNDITTKENPWCTQEKVSSLDFHKSQSEIESLDITIDETNSITIMYKPFGFMGYLRSVKLNMPKAASLRAIPSMFDNSIHLTSINFINFDTSNVTAAQGAFHLCSSLTSLDLSNWDTSNFQDCTDMFSGCSSLTSLDVSNWNTSNLTIAESMFNGCSSLTSLDVSNFDMSKVTIASWMFNDCSSLTSLDVSNWDTSNLTTAESMFDECSSLTSLNLKNWNTSNLTIAESMFYGCSSLTSLDVSNFDMSKVTNADWMFWKCPLNYIKCTQAFKDWCWKNQKSINLPAAMREGGTGTWAIVN